MKRGPSMKQYDYKKGLTTGIAAYLIWGLLPIYWKLIESVHAGAVLAHRIIWSFIFMFLFILFTKRLKQFWHECKAIIHHRRNALIVISASLIISCNWLIFIWAVQSGYVIQASLGYYINPLVSVLFGVLFFKEKLTNAQTISTILAGIGVLYLTFSYGVFPWVSLSLAVSFAIYGVLKKWIDIESLFSLTLETILLFPIAIIYLVTVFGDSYGFLNESFSTTALLMASGVATAVPLLLFGISVQYIPLSTVGFLQYIAPTIMLFIGVFLYKEQFTFDHFITFMLIWISLALFMQSSLAERKKDRKART